MAIETKFPLTRQELAAIDTGLVRFPAGFAEYWAVLGKAEYRADFLQNEIIAMSYESNLHSKIVSEMMWLLRNIFPRPKYSIHDSNRPVYLPDCGSGKAVFNPDCCVTPEPPALFKHKTGLDAETNPLVIVEVLSKSTNEYDFAEKLPCYKKIDSLRYIVYVDSLRTFVTVFERIRDTDQWINTDYDQLDGGFTLADKTISLTEIYSHLPKV